MEDEGRIRSLRSRHLNNLLSTSLSPTEADRLSDKVQRDQDRMTQITEQLQGLWLEMLLVLSEPSSPTNNSAESDEGDNESPGGWFFRVGKSKRQAFKVSRLFSRLCSAFHCYLSLAILINQIRSLLLSPHRTFSSGETTYQHQHQHQHQPCTITVRAINNSFRSIPVTRKKRGCG